MTIAFVWAQTGNRGIRLGQGHGAIVSSCQLMGENQFAEKVCIRRQPLALLIAKTCGIAKAILCYESESFRKLTNQ